MWSTPAGDYYRVKYGRRARLRCASSPMPASSRMRCCVPCWRCYPGRLEMEVARPVWVGRMLGSERDGFQIMVGANTANRTLIGPALNRPIRYALGSPACCAEGDAAFNRLHSLLHCCGLADESMAGAEVLVRSCRGGWQSASTCTRSRGQAIARPTVKSTVDFAGLARDPRAVLVGEINLAQQKPYTGRTIPATECQEFFGAITLDSSGTVRQSDCHALRRSVARNRETDGTTS